jgi:hypothetical protein
MRTALVLFEVRGGFNSTVEKEQREGNGRIGFERHRCGAANLVDRSFRGRSEI